MDTYHQPGSIAANPIQDDSPTTSASSSTNASDEVQIAPKQSWRSYIWDSLDKSPEERRFLAKLDAVLLTYASLGELVEAFEQLNIYNAFVSGMKEDLHMYGNELNYMLTAWTAGYIIGQIPRSGLHGLRRRIVLMPP
jgi:MFS transporter, ACS family, pantothenate transporter